jgi:bifunctional oligoribonuclease and PAP phosphatase NrnA
VAVINEDREVLYRNVARQIESNDEFLIITHIFPDGDALGTLTAFNNLIASMNKKTTMICNSVLPYQYKFLPGFNKIKKHPGLASLLNHRPVCIMVDCAGEDRAGLDFDYLRKKSSCIINIDHHRSNSCFGDINIVDGNKSATAEMLYELIYKNYREKLSYDIGIGIYVGILTDTGRFQYSNTTANVHRIASELIEIGIKPSDVYGYIYESDPLGRFKLIQKVFSRIAYVKSLSLIYSYMLKEDFTRLKIPFYAQDGIIELLRSAEGAKITVLIKQIDINSFKVSLRTSDSNIDLSNIASSFGGGGHRAASAYKHDGSLKKVIESMKEAIKNWAGK